jgi:hypothetical protein
VVEARLEQLSTVGQVQVNLLPSKVAISGVKVRCVYGVHVCLCAFKGVGSGARAPAVCASGVPAVCVSLSVHAQGELLMRRRYSSALFTCWRTPFCV